MTQIQNVPIYPLDSRIIGSYGVDTQLFLTKPDGTYWDLSAYTFQIEASLDGAAKAWTKTTGFTGAAGTSTTPNLTIVWLVGDMGALTAGDWKLELTMTTASSKPVKLWFMQRINGPEVS